MNKIYSVKENQQRLLKAFNKHLTKILKRFDTSDPILINQLTDFIITYYQDNSILIKESENDNQNDEDNRSDRSDENNTSEKSDEENTSEKSDEDNESSKKSSGTSSRKSSLKLDDSDDSDKSKVIIEKNDILFNYFINNNSEKTQLLFNPNYDIEKNIITFIRNSLSY